MGDGTEQNPYTREDVLKAIEENGGKAEGLDLSGKVFVKEVDLSNLNLRGIILNETDFSGMYSWPTLGGSISDSDYSSSVAGAHFESADLVDASFKDSMLAYSNFERAILSHSNFEKACMWNVNFTDAECVLTKFQEADLNKANFTRSNLISSHFSKADLSDCIFLEATIYDSHMEESILHNADLKWAGLANANLHKAKLINADIRGTDFTGVDLANTYLEDAKFDSNTVIQSAEWSKYILPEEEENWFVGAREIYRKLKIWHTNAGIYETAGQFFFREMTMKRKTLKWWPNPLPRLFSKLLSILCGYGEKWERVIISASIVIFGLAIIYYIFGAFNPGTFAGDLYYSVVSFTALGYGNWVMPEPMSWAKGFGAAEAAIGVFMMALFLVTFTRKMTR